MFWPFQTARSQGLTKWQLHAWCLRIHPWGCSARTFSVFGQQFHPMSEIFPWFICFIGCFCKAPRLDFGQSPKLVQMVCLESSPTPDTELGSTRSMQLMTQMPDFSLPYLIFCFNSQQMVTIDSLFQTCSDHQRINMDQSCGVSVACIGPKTPQGSETAALLLNPFAAQYPTFVVAPGHSPASQHLRASWTPRSLSPFTRYIRYMGPNVVPSNIS